MSKGSSPRPYGVSLDTYGSNFDRIFGKQPPFSGDDCFHPSSITIVDEPEEIDEPAAESDDDEWTCSSCGGPMYRQPHWSYGQCDDCGRREELEQEAP